MTEAVKQTDGTECCCTFFLFFESLLHSFYVVVGVTHSFSGENGNASERVCSVSGDESVQSFIQ